MPKTSNSAAGALSCLIAELDTMIELLNCDCMEYMATVPDKYFDLAIVDPPYGLGMKNFDSSKYSGFGANSHSLIVPSL